MTTHLIDAKSGRIDGAKFQGERMNKRYIGIIPLIMLMAAFIAPSVLAGAPGSGPNDPLMVTGTSVVLAPKGNAWFYFDYTAAKSRVEVGLNANGAGNIGFGIYTPQSAKDWLNDPTVKPVGIGSKPGSQTSAAQLYDLVWAGSFNEGGRYFIVVNNTGDTSVQYRLFVKGEYIALAPTPTKTPLPDYFKNPFATPILVGNIDGKFLFQEASGGIIYTVNGDGSQLTRIGAGLDPNWSPDGKQITFSRWGVGGGVFIANADGTGERNLIPGLNKALSPQFSPNGKWIVFSQQKGGTEVDSQICFGSFCFTIAADPHWKLGLLDVNAGTLTEPRTSDHSFAPTWGADNKTIAYADATFGIMKTTILTDTQWLVNGQNPAVQSASWSPDGNKIAYTIKVHDRWQVVVMNADGSNVLNLTPADPLSFVGVNNVAPTWSPDSKQILFLSDRNGKWEFFVVNTDGTGLTQVLKTVSDAVTIQFNFNNERVIDWFK